MSAVWLAAFAHWDRLLAIARRRSPNLHDAEDVVMEAMIRVATMPGVDPDRIGHLLTTVVKRLCVDRLRRECAERAAVGRSDGALRPDEPTSAVDDAAEAAWLAAVASGLDGHEAAALAARVLGLTAPQIGELLGITPKAAESALRRARLKLRAAWRTTLAIPAWLLHRIRPRYAAGAVGTAYVAAAVAIATVPWPGGRAPVPAPSPRETVAAAVTTTVRASPPRPPLHAAHPVVRPTMRPTAAAARTAGTTVRVPAASAGPVAHEGSRVSIGEPEDLPGAVARCVDGGVHVGLHGVVCGRTRG